MLHILIAQFQGNTLGKSVFSRLELGFMCSNIERCIFRAPSLGASFLRRTYEKNFSLYNIYLSLLNVKIILMTIIIVMNINTSILIVGIGMASIIGKSVRAEIKI